MLDRSLTRTSFEIDKKFKLLWNGNMHVREGWKKSRIKYELMRKCTWISREASLFLDLLRWLLRRNVRKGVSESSQVLNFCTRRNTGILGQRSWIGNSRGEHIGFEENLQQGGREKEEKRDTMLYSLVSVYLFVFEILAICYIGSRRRHFCTSEQTKKMVR